MYCERPSASIQNLPNAHRIANQVICLPLYPAMQETDLDRISEFIRQAGSRQ